MPFWPRATSGQSRAAVAALSVGLTLLVAYVDYTSGPGISMSAYYLLPLALATWYLGAVFAALLMVLSLFGWVVANALNGDPTFGTPVTVAWNGTVQLISDAIVVLILSRLRDLQESLESRAQGRAEALTREIAEREHLQRALLAVSEREQRRIGRDLHDGLCQQLAATALTCQVLQEELAEKDLPEAVRAQKVVELIQESIYLSRQSARGLDPVAMDAAGLMMALEEYSANTTRLFRIACDFECESPVLIHDPEAAEHLFRIAQEAVRNAVVHAQPRHIRIGLETVETGLELRVEDDGVGIAKSRPSRTGMGLRIMAQRARLIGAAFAIEGSAAGGTVVTCLLPTQIGTEERYREPAPA
jgi:signal transduction histidine kinase